MILALGAPIFLSAADPTTREYFAISTVNEYAHPEKALAALAQRSAKSPINHFCVIGVRGKDYSFAEVYWRENNTLTLWEPGNPNNTESLLLSRRVWKVKKDVVPTSKEVGFSTYLITREEVDQTLSACKQLGTQFVIHRKKRSSSTITRKTQ